MNENISEFKKAIADGSFDSELSRLYAEDLEAEKRRYLSALEGFEEKFGRRAVRIFSAPGRTELCGNHTDHQGGCVLAAAIDLDMIAVAAQRSDTAVHIASQGFGEFSADISDSRPKAEEKGTAQALARGVAAAIRDRGFAPGGFDAYLSSRVPKGSGLSSSAALEVLIGKIFSTFYCDNGLDNIALAQIGQLAENEYFGKPCGLMDQMACALGGVAFIDFAKPGSPQVETLDFSFEKTGYSLYITNAGGSHAELTAEYAAITQEMGAVAQCFGKTKLSQVERVTFFGQLPQVRERVCDRAILRAMHFFGENERVKAQLCHLKQGNVGQYLRLMRESGQSSMGLLQNIWPGDKSERSVALALAVSDLALHGEGASRIHGGGFAGTIQALVPTAQGQEYKAAMDSVFGEGACRRVSVRCKAPCKT